MPLLLKIIAIFSYILGGMLVSFLLPIYDYSISGEEVSYSEFWSHKDSYVFLCSGIMMLLIAEGIRRRKYWSRHLVVLFFPLNIALEYFVKGGDLSDVTTSLAVYAAFIAPFIGWYLYVKESVHRYFAENV